MDFLREHKKAEVAMIVLCVAILLPIFMISFYNRASADDYDYALLTHQVIKDGGNIFELLGAAFRTTVQFYQTWQGLYTSAFILSLQPAIFGEAWYALSAPIVMLFAYMCLHISVHILNKHFLGRSAWFTASASLSLLTVLVLWMPSATEGLFWFNGAMNYMPFVFLNFLNLCVLLEAYSADKKTRRYVLVGVCTVLSFLISGGNHVTAFSNILLLLIVCISLLCYKKRYYLSVFPLASAVIGFLIMYLAPGTAIRQMRLEGKGILETIWETVKHVRYIMGDWISLVWLLSLLLITPIAIEIAAKNKERFSKRFPFLPLILSLGIVCGMFCVPYLPMGYFGEPRVTNVIWIMFMLLSWLNYILIWGWLVANGFVDVERIGSIRYLQLAKSVLVVVCMVGLFLVQDGYETSNSYEAITELKDGVAQSYCEEMDARFSLYNDVSLSDVPIKPLTVKSELLFFADFGYDADQWPNTSIGAYYHKRIYLRD